MAATQSWTPTNGIEVRWKRTRNASISIWNSRRTDCGGKHPQLPADIRENQSGAAGLHCLAVRGHYV